MDTLILVDLQNDFLPGGALPVPGGDAVIPVANRLLAAERFGLVVATQDWHPASHASFAANHPGRRPGESIALDGIDQILWPVHCVQGTAGADFAPGLNRQGIQHVVQKGVDPRIDSYSGFFDNGRRRATGLGPYLAGKGAQSLFILGLATDYCVKCTVLDALELGFGVTVLVEGCRAIEARPGDGGRALEEMRRAGATLA